MRLCRLVSVFLVVLFAQISAWAQQAVLPVSREVPQQWRFTTTHPGKNWYDPAYDDSAWKQSTGSFGRRIPWKEQNLWARRTIELTTDTLPKTPFVRCSHDDDMELYINGVFVLARPGFTTEYRDIPLALASLHAGPNTIAVHCRQTTGGQFLDLGIYDAESRKPVGKSSTQVTANFQVPNGPHLVKDKFNVYNCPYFKMDRWFRDLHLLRDLGVKSLRYDPTWGGHNVGIDFNSPQISGTAAAPVYNFADFDRFTDSLLALDIQPMYVMAYTPLPLQKQQGVWGDKPTDMSAWKRICGDYAAHWKNTGRKVPYYEIWNEPDNPPFSFRGTMEEYFEIYRFGATGIKEADPDALVGGPAVAALENNDKWIAGFLRFINDNNLPLDFVSFHNYGNPVQIIEKARALVRQYPRFAKLPMMLTEYNSYVPLTNDFEDGGDMYRHVAASRLLDDFEKLLEHPDVTRVYWAMFNDPDTQERVGLVGLDGRRKAAFNAFRIYMDMPVQRYAVDTRTTSVRAFASSDGTKAGVVVWNLSLDDVQTTISLQGIPNAFSKMREYRIDREHGSYYDTPNGDDLVPLSEKTIPPDRTEWQGNLPAGGVVYLKLGGPVAPLQDPR